MMELSKIATYVFIILIFAIAGLDSKNKVIDFISSIVFIVLLSLITINVVKLTKRT